MVPNFIKRFFAGIGGAMAMNGMPKQRYPFTFPEKALTSDWKSIGKDLQNAIDKHK